MAESQEEQSESNNWWGSWIQAAKEKSSQALEFIKHDLNEFSAVCSQDASAVVSSTSETLQQSLQGDGEGSNTAYVKRGLTNLLGGITRVLTIPPDDDSQDDLLRVSSNGSFEVFDKAKARLYEIQTSAQTYCTEPDGSADAFNAWKETFDLDSRKGEISDLLVSVDEVRSIYTKLVPSAVAHSDFWQRYYYKVHQLEEDERRKTNLKNRADKFNVDSSEQAWEDDWEADESTEQVQLKSTESDSQAVELVAAPDSDTKAEVADTVVTEVSEEPKATESIPLESKSEDTPAAVPEPSSTDLADLSGNSSTHAQKETVDSTAEDLTATAHVLAEEPTATPHVPAEEPTAAPHVPAESAPQHTTEEDASIPNPSGEPVADSTSSSAVEAGAPASVPQQDIKVKEKGSFVVVSSDNKTPASSVGSSNSKESSSGLDDDWDKDMFGDDMKAVQDLVEELEVGKADTDLDDWESWE